MTPIIESTTADGIITELEAQGYGWDIGYSGSLRECRIWIWPHVVGRYRPSGSEPLADMLLRAIGGRDC